MKIDDATITLTPQSPNGKQSNQSQFAQWINQPTKDCSGDEYYWQHQAQLQQSALHFEKPSTLNPKQTAQTKEIALNKIVLSERDSQSSERLNLYPATLLPIPDATNHNVIATPIEKTETTYFQSMPVDLFGTTPEQLIAKQGVNSVEAIDGTAHQTTDYSSFKNHHLFVQEDIAELTLNAQQLDAKQQQQLSQMIRQSLKNKGLTLTQLIINGVKK